MAITILDQNDKSALEQQIATKLDKSGWTPNKFLGVDAQGNVVVKDTPEGSGGNTNGLSDTAKALLITILRNGVYNTDQSANITALETAFASGGSGGEEEPDIPVVPDEPDEPSANGTLLYNWDFTKSLTDTVAGNTATLNGAGATQDSNGLSLVQSDKTPAYASFASNIHGANRRYEFDVSSISKTSNLNVYFLHCTALAGLFYISNAWKFYSAKSWTYKETGLTDVGAFNGKTVSVVINEDYSWDLYTDGELVAQSGEAISKSGNALTIGCTSTTSGASMELLVTGLRVYDIGGV